MAHSASILECHGRNVMAIVASSTRPNKNADDWRSGTDGGTADPGPDQRERSLRSSENHFSSLGKIEQSHINFTVLRWTRGFSPTFSVTCRVYMVRNSNMRSTKQTGPTLP